MHKWVHIWYHTTCSYTHMHRHTQHNTCMYMCIHTRKKVIKVNTDSDCKDGWILDYVVKDGFLQTHNIFFFGLYKLFCRNKGTRQKLAEFILWMSPTWTHVCLLHMKTTVHTFTHIHTQTHAHRACVHKRDRLKYILILTVSFSNTPLKLFFPSWLGHSILTGYTD